jgi:hypothetical protein
MMLGYGLLFLLICFFAYTIYKQKTQDVDKVEGFYPRRWWWGPNMGPRLGWRRSWLHGWGNWRPHGYYPAYSGYWKQCESGTWCPATINCASPACQ